MLNVWEYDGPEMVIALSAERAYEIIEKEFGYDPAKEAGMSKADILATFKAVPDARRISIQTDACRPDGTELVVELAAYEWVAVYGDERFICSTEF